MVFCQSIVDCRRRFSVCGRFCSRRKRPRADQLVVVAVLAAQAQPASDDVLGELHVGEQRSKPVLLRLVGDGIVGEFIAGIAIAGDESPQRAAEMHVVARREIQAEGQIGAGKGVVAPLVPGPSRRPRLDIVGRFPAVIPGPILVLSTVPNEPASTAHRLAPACPFPAGLASETTPRRHRFHRACSLRALGNFDLVVGEHPGSSEEYPVIRVGVVQPHAVDQEQGLVGIGAAQEDRGRGTGLARWQRGRRWESRTEHPAANT